MKKLLFKVKLSFVLTDDWNLGSFAVLPWSHAKKTQNNYLPYCRANECRNPQHWKWCMLLQILTERLGAQPAAAAGFLIQVTASTWWPIAAFRGHIDFSPTLQIIAGCCESYPPRAAGRSFFSMLTQEWLSDLCKTISWNLTVCNWLLYTSRLWYKNI